MINETDLKVEKKIFFDRRCDMMKNNFQKRRLNFHPVYDKNQVLYTIDSLIKDKWKNAKSIAFSDSVSLHQIGVYAHIEKEYTGYEIINPFKRTADGKYLVFNDVPEGEKLDLPRDEYYRRMSIVVEQMRQTLVSDVLIIGANAITMRGEIVSIDGSGNRVAGMFFGPKHVIIVCGINKLCVDLNEALLRIRNIAAPLNYIRHDEKHHNRYHELPCVQNGKCFDCSNPRSACRKIAIMRGEVEFNADRTHLILVNDDLGL